MTQTLKFALLTGLVLGLPSLAAAADADRLTMHRVGAGTLDANGWTDASSTGGAISVRLPCQFNDFSFEGDPGEDVAKAYVIGCKRADGAKFSATRFAYREGAAGAERHFGKARDAGIPSGTKPVLTRFGKDAALDTVTHEGNGCGWARMIRSGNDNVLLIAEAKEPACGTIEADVHKFLSSARLGS